MKKILAVILILALMTAACASLAEETESAAVPFETMGDTRKGSDWTAYSAPDYFIVLTKQNGCWWRVDAQIDDRFREMSEGLAEAEDPEKAYAEYEAYLNALPVASAVVLAEQPADDGTLNAWAGKPLRDILAEGYGIDYIQALTTGDAGGDDGTAETISLTDDEGVTCEVRFYCYPSDFRACVTVCLKKGIYDYGVYLDITDEQLLQAVEEGTWGDLKAGSVTLRGLTAETACRLPGPVGMEPEDGEKAEEAEETTLRTIGQIEELLNRACYVNPDGGAYVHTVPDCATVHPKFIPLTKVEYTDEIKAAYAFCPVCCLNEYSAETQGE